MALNGKYFIQDQLHTPHAHHQSFKALWEGQWKKPCTLGVYPFMFAAIQDFQPIADELIAKDLKEPYDWDEYASTFIPHGDRLAAIAEAAEQEGNREKAAEYYLRAGAVYRIARFPISRSVQQKIAWRKNVDVATKGLKLRNSTTEAVQVPHVHAGPEDGKVVPIYYDLPASASAMSKVPLLLIICGLDGYRTDVSAWIQPLHDHGCASIIVEIPGTGDSPGNPSDPQSGLRVFDSLLDWIAAQSGIDQGRIGVWGLSTGGYNAIQLAHHRPDTFAGTVAQGGGVHHMFDRAWLEAADVLEYPFDLAHSLMARYGYSDFEAFKAEAQGRYSLLLDGTLDKRCGPLMLLNGMDDSIFPIDDYLLVLQRGGSKQARFFEGLAHMGEPQATPAGLAWLSAVMGVQFDAAKFMGGQIYKAKY